MKELIEEIEYFQEDIRRDLGLDHSLLTDQAIIDSIGNWEYFSKIRDREAERENHLKMFRNSMEKVALKSSEGDIYALAEKLKKAYHQNEINQ
ncbi:uncharacterized protein Eint_051205 [Encephalitozoon intestinalis ATCC 50506]|uniref:Uncharacterized protein n=1 Tax=Encephalitozoon intestinalis (strain ATCC 50506) TaxID=876142 RepID=W8Q1V5_ENCIT|nr:uncharacterized protein Eint_051205 [Encephalitozoon intestinalis ATCC 50506]AHL30104.1 hypothetical protein Eint_051205 [Encephalitozoon intestinalis ATCC 50506]UTX45283.1 hypothetical protein GPK93_05g08290 [Encephalitozoon intestinalis]